MEAIAFFDLFDLPLNSFDIWQSLRVKVSYEEVLDVLEKDVTGILDKQGPFYFLKGREKMLTKARRQFHLSQRKKKIAKKASNILKFVNGVKMVAVCNNFYYQEESDIDVFIVIRKNRIWTARSISTLLLHIFGLRRHGKKIKDRICLSFYITEDRRYIRDIALPDNDPYLDFWIKNLNQLYDKGLYSYFLKDNDWLKKRFPNMIKISPVDSWTVKDNFFSNMVKRVNGLWFDNFLGDMVEKAFKKIQIYKMSGNKSSLSSQPDSRVLISDDILKFHENDRRREFKKRLNDKKKEIEINHIKIK